MGCPLPSPPSSFSCSLSPNLINVSQKKESREDKKRRGERSRGEKDYLLWGGEVAGAITKETTNMLEEVWRSKERRREGRRGACVLYQRCVVLAHRRLIARSSHLQRLHLLM